MKNYLRLFFGVAAAAGFLLAAVVHVAALLGHDVEARFPQAGLLHLGIFVVFIPFIVFARQELGNQPDLFQFSASVPRWAATVAAIIMVYAVANFFLSMAHTQGGSPTVENGKYLLIDHGKLIRELTVAEYHALKADVTRRFSGHWLMFYFISAAYLLFGKRPGLPVQSQPAR
jgi:hypothetical protein